MLYTRLVDLFEVWAYLVSSKGIEIRDALKLLQRLIYPFGSGKEEICYLKLAESLRWVLRLLILLAA